MDLRSLVAAGDVSMDIKIGDQPLLNDTGEVMTIIFHGPDSDAHIAARNKWINAIKQLTARERIMTAEDDLRVSVDFLVGVTKGWAALQDNGAALEYSAESARKLYSGIPALREQAAAFAAKLGLRSNFPTAASKS